MTRAAPDYFRRCGRIPFGLAVFLACSGIAAAQEPALNPLTDAVPGLSQELVQVGSGQFTLTARGSGFTSNSVVRLGTTSLATTFIDAGALSAVVPPVLIKSLGTLGVSVIDGSSASNALSLRAVVRGDANASGTVNIGDALVLARSAGGLLSPTVPSRLGDANLSDAFNIGDALVIALFSGGLTNNLATPVITGTNVTGSAAPGAEIGITGTGFSSSPTDNRVFFSRTDGTFLHSTAKAVSVGSNSKTITVTVPVDAASGPIFVKRDDLGIPGQPFGLSVAGAAPPVYITKVTPSSGLVPGAAITIAGTGFGPVAANNAVLFSQAGASTISTAPSVATDTSLTVTVPVGAVSGFVDVMTGSSTSNRKSIIVSGTPTPLLVNHVYYSDLPGEPVLIEGTGFNITTPSDNEVLFTTSSGEQAGTVVMVGRTELIALVPAGTISGSLRITNNNGENVSNDFNFRAAGASGASPFSGRIEYEYDVLNRLIEVRYPHTVIQYTYDPAGNRLGMSIMPR